MQRGVRCVLPTAFARKNAIALELVRRLRLQDGEPHAVGEGANGVGVKRDRSRHCARAFLVRLSVANGDL